MVSATFRPCWLRSERKHRGGIEWDNLKTWWTVSWHKYLNTTFHNYVSCLDSWICVCAREDGDRLQRYGRDKSERVDNVTPPHERPIKPPWDDLPYKMPTIKPALFASLLIVRPSGLVHLREFAQIYGMYFPSVCHNSKQTLSHDTKPHAHRGNTL
jgi:hypothetical protein